MIKPTIVHFAVATVMLRRGWMLRIRGSRVEPRRTYEAEGAVDIRELRTLHKPALEKCFIANSVNSPVECEPEIVEAG
jgi:hypothetical protein